MITPSQTRPPYDDLTYTSCTLCLHWCRFFPLLLLNTFSAPFKRSVFQLNNFDPSARTDLGLRQYGFFKYLSVRPNVFRRWGRKKFPPRNSACTSFSSISAQCRANSCIAAFIHQVVLSKFLQQTFIRGVLKPQLRFMSVHVSCGHFHSWGHVRRCYYRCAATVFEKEQHLRYCVSPTVMAAF